MTLNALADPVQVCAHRSNQTQGNFRIAELKRPQWRCHGYAHKVESIPFGSTITSSHSSPETVELLRDRVGHVAEIELRRKARGCVRGVVQRLINATRLRVVCNSPKEFRNQGRWRRTLTRLATTIYGKEGFVPSRDAPQAYRAS